MNVCQWKYQDRLDRLEAENRELTAANAELTKADQETAVTIAAVSEKTDTVAAEVKDQASKSSWTDKKKICTIMKSLNFVTLLTAQSSRLKQTGPSGPVLLQ
jgi:hypothetical protein